MKQIPLTQGLFAMVDDDMFDCLSGIKWYARKSRNTFYAEANAKNHHKNGGTIRMHHLILNPPNGVFIDHKNGNGLDNQRSNLRFATASQNQCNRGKQKNSTSGFKGVHKDKDRWRSEIKINRKMKNLGRFKNPEEAAKAYDKAAKRYHGEFAYSNN